MTLEAALAEKEQVLDLVTLNNQPFVKTMRKIAVDLAKANGAVTSDDLRLLADKYGLKPMHQNSWGAIFSGKCWKVIGRKPSLYKSNHARELKVWAYVAY